MRSLDCNATPRQSCRPGLTHSAPCLDRLSEEREVGSLSINHPVASIAETPFGGVKDSGHGREGGSEGLARYTVTKNVSHRMSAT